MMNLKKDKIGSKAFVPQLGKVVTVNEESAPTLKACGMMQFFEDAKPVKKTKVTKPKTETEDKDPD